MLLAKAVLKHHHEIDPGRFDAAFDRPALKAWKEQWEKARPDLRVKYTEKYTETSPWHSVSLHKLRK